uniref:DUF659 domain-containing protein n=2 Tax=Brassica oleracea var. oleracea TaxID=109376 RepID=A0A0D3E7Q2_BRAOL
MSKTPYIKAPLWIYVNKIEKIVGGESWRFECKFCSNTYVGSYTRVVTHLLQEVVKGIKGCLKVTPQQKVNMKKLVNDCKERIKRSASTPVPLPSSSRKASASSLDYDMSYKFPDTSETVSKKRKAREQCDGEIFRMFCTSGLSFNVARNPHYRNSYVRASQIPGYVPPGYNALRTTLLQKERKNIEVHLQPLKDSWKQKGIMENLFCQSEEIVYIDIVSDPIFYLYDDDGWIQYDDNEFYGQVVDKLSDEVTRHNIFLLVGGSNLRQGYSRFGSCGASWAFVKSDPVRAFTHHRSEEMESFMPIFPGILRINRSLVLFYKASATSVSICSDGWSDPHRRPSLNLIAANESGPMMLRAVNIQGEAKTGEVIAEMIIECIKEVGHENVVQVLTDNASNCVKAGALILSKFPTIFWTPFVVHTLNLALKNICAHVYNTRSNEEVYDACYWIKSISEDATWIKNFIMNHGVRLVMFTEHCDLKLLTIASTRFASTVVMPKRFKKIKTGLQQMVISPKWDDYKDDGVERASTVKKKILDEMLWDEIDYALSFTLPIYNVIRAADTDKPSLHLVYEWWESMIQTVKKFIFRKERKELEDDSVFWNAVQSILTSRWSKSNTPLHCMAHSLNPKYYSSEWLREENSRKCPHQDLEITRERKNCIMKYFSNQDERREVNIEYSNFSLSLKDFGSVDAIHNRFIVEPLRWWAVHGSSAPKLQALAFKLL